MITRRLVISTLVAVAFTTLSHGMAWAETSAEKIEQAKTVKEFLALGATKLTAAEFKSKIVGKKLAGKGWTWIIAADGTTSSTANDGSWKEDNQPWSMKGDQYCTKLDGKKKCRDVYMIGKYFRMSDKDSKKALGSWTATAK